MFLGFDVDIAVVAIIETVKEIQRITLVNAPHNPQCCAHPPDILMTGVGRVIIFIFLLKLICIEGVDEFRPQIGFDGLGLRGIFYTNLRTKNPIGSIMFI